jgi:deoxycytidine triphosphate deaminase
MELLTPLGYDLTIGGSYLSFARGNKFDLNPGDTFAIRSGETVLISTEEYLGFPRDGSLAGLIESKVSMVSLGLSHVSTTLDPDWEGHLLIAITNHQPYQIELSRGQPFCTAMFLKCMTPTDSPSNKEPGRKQITEGLLVKWLQEANTREQKAKQTQPPWFRRRQTWLFLPAVLVIIILGIVIWLALVLDKADLALVLATVAVAIIALAQGYTSFITGSK